MNLSIIIQVIVAIPKIVSMIGSVIKTIKELQLKAQEEQLASAVLRAKQSQTKTEAEIAARDISKHIP